MKKSIALMAGVLALALMVTPALAFNFSQKPQVERVTNIVRVSNDSSALANTGLNKQIGGGVMMTGLAEAQSTNFNSTNVGVAGCCQTGQSLCGCFTPQPSTTTTNRVAVDNDSMAMANTGGNMQVESKPVMPNFGWGYKPSMPTGGMMTTGDAGAYSGNENYVNVSVTGM